MTDTALIVNVNVPEETASALNAAVEAGEYEGIGDIVAEALMQWRARRNAGGDDDLRTLIQAGIDSGPGLGAREVFEGLRARHDAKHGV